MLTYMEVHLYYTLPVLGILLAILRPFHSSQDTFKYGFLCAMAFSTASLWDNYIVYHRAWWYCPLCVTAVIGYVPLEEYMFFIIMSLMTVAFTNLVMRWHLPSTFIKPDAPVFKSIIIRYLPIAVLLSIGVRAWNSAVPNTHLFYGSCILWYTCPVLALLWFGSSEYICSRYKGVLISIVLPTIYLCWVDKVAIAAGTWHISLRTSTGIMVAPSLPLEEFLFFLLINVVLVFATCAIDRAQAILHLYGMNAAFSYFSFMNNSEHVTRLVNLTYAFYLSDQALHADTFHDLHTAWRILKQASFSFYTASAVFPTNVRQDLGVLYGFCRATDDIADDEETPVEQRKEQLATVRQCIYDMFATKNPAALDWSRYDLPSSCISSLRAFARLCAPKLQVDAVNELLDGYEFDLNRSTVETEADLECYSACVASSVGEMCTRLMLPYPDSWTIERARDMGLVLQYTNIARDIVTDSQELRRCYLPRDWLSSKESEAMTTGCVEELGQTRLRSLAMKLLVGRADRWAGQARRGIDRLPFDCQGGVRAACAVYMAIGNELIKEKGYPKRAYVSTSQRIWVVLKSVYKTSLPSTGFLQASINYYNTITRSSQKNLNNNNNSNRHKIMKTRKGKQRAFCLF
ncbi:Lycopene beta-cyclase [Phascolomyces articulosus]|uniref:Bifunctional lycopene cyclase/phytoene synthase n=1 Tax=Phascolomyces articulosus TaxID=60185 RepID=A0AAD5PJQ6_9FUNG|nr:Lycopene beta-cyclase [Phascolomyces articulosus]